MNSSLFERALLLLAGLMGLFGINTMRQRKELGA
ncbi:MAG TPA: IPTL-CTERM sorting domain-containing protein [Gammaproteobacteria bacterium]|nr:IPTL-CTERM sorting domain-containing protein [Gammaproteobacteria bacterium]